MTTQLLLTWLLGGLVGSMLFFAVTVAPTVFRSLPGDHAGAFLRAFFPRYYGWGFVVALICCPVALVAGNALLIAVCALVLLMFVYARQFLMPAINRARDRELAGQAGASGQFRLLHLQSVIINVLQLLLLIGATVYLLWL